MNDKECMKRCLKMLEEESILFDEILYYIRNHIELLGMIADGCHSLTVEYYPYVKGDKYDTYEELREDFKADYYYFIKDLWNIDGKVVYRGLGHDLLEARFCESYFIGAIFDTEDTTILLNPFADFTLLLEATK